MSIRLLQETLEEKVQNPSAGAQSSEMENVSPCSVGLGMKVLRSRNKDAFLSALQSGYRW